MAHDGWDWMYPALSNGLEWNLKVSEYTSKDVVDSFKKTFETYWNDEEFRTFDSTDENNKKELKELLSMKQRDESSYVFFDLRPYSHQREILEDLRLEREEYGSYKNLVVAATGERVIIVTGCINVLVSRVSGTFIQKNRALLRAIRYNCCKQCMRSKDFGILIIYNYLV